MLTGSARHPRRMPDAPALLGVLVAIVYLVFGALALSWYPGPFSPATNWLSDLGNTTVNPAAPVTTTPG